MESTKNEPVAARRNFLKEGLAALLGSIVAVIPGLAGLAVFLDPLRRKGGSQGRLIRVASMGAIPADGTPAKFSVVADKIDAWNKFSETPIGAVYLRRDGPDKIVALNVVCPHAGCFVTLQKSGKEFLCPCHDSRFALDGRITSPSSPSPRGLDSLEVELRKDEIWVRFQNFQPGKKEKAPVG